MENGIKFDEEESEISKDENFKLKEGMEVKNARQKSCESIHSEQKPPSSDTILTNNDENLSEDKEPHEEVNIVKEVEDDTKALVIQTQSDSLDEDTNAKIDKEIESIETLHEKDDDIIIQEDSNTKLNKETEKAEDNRGKRRRNNYYPRCRKRCN